MSRLIYLAEGIIAGSIFGTASIFVRLLTNINIDIYFIAIGRLLIASFAIYILSYPFLKREYGKIFKELRSGLLQHLILGGFLGIHFILFIAGVRDTTIANATLLVNTIPIQSLVLSIVILRMKAGKIDYLSVLLAFLGALILSYPNLGSGRILGDIESFLAATMLSLYLVIGKKIRAIFHPLASMPIIYLLAAIVISPFLLIYSTPSISSYFRSDAILYLLLLGILPTGVGHTLFYSSLKGLKPHETSIMGLLEPVGATILAVIIFNEYPNPLIYIGGTLIALAVIITSYTYRIDKF
jgi:drug/metabolite transporter (DMT)-like permease